METKLTSGKQLSLKEIDLKRVYSEKKKKHFYAVHHDGVIYFVSKSLKNGDEINKEAFKDGVQLGTITSDDGTQNICWKANSWEAVSLLIADKEIVSA